MTIRTVIVGAGVVGVASAYMLCRAGHSVVLIDRNHAPGQGASFANGAQLSYSFCDPLASWGLLSKIPSILGGRDRAFRIDLDLDPQFIAWGLRFIANCSPGRAAGNTRYLTAMALETRRVIKEIVEAAEIDFSYAEAGKMVLYGSREALSRAEPMREIKRQAGVPLSVLSRDEALDIEPALRHYNGEIAGAVYSAEDAVGFADQFCSATVRCLETSYGLETRFGHEANRLISRNGAVCGIALGSGEIIGCDRVVLATGHETNLIGQMGAWPGSVWPVRGYSITRPASPSSLKVSITDLGRKTVYARVGETIRIAGFADIGKRPGAAREDRLRDFAKSAESAFAPGITGGPAVLDRWSGFRPCAPSSRPIIGQGRLSGLYLNLAHGGLGWTLCLGSAGALVKAMGDC